MTDEKYADEYSEGYADGFADGKDAAMQIALNENSRYELVFIHEKQIALGIAKKIRALEPKMDEEFIDA